jgi:hypothetical protein
MFRLPLYVKKKGCSDPDCTLIHVYEGKLCSKFLFETCVFPGSFTQMIKLGSAYLRMPLDDHFLQAW